jgi:hypothetical protein
MSKVPSALPTVSRRRVLISGAALALLSTTAAGCGAPAKRPDVEALVAQLDRARADSQLAAGAASAARPDVAAALTTVAAERSAHVQALSDEITRISGEVPQASASASPTSTSTTGEPLPPPKPRDVVAALKQSADSAAQAAAQQSGYSAGLLGSIAASCTAAYTVGLGDGQSS